MKTFPRFNDDEIPPTLCLVCKHKFLSRTALATHTHGPDGEPRDHSQRRRCKICRNRQRRMQGNCPEHPARVKKVKVSE
jgi:hypothetical protein